ncbi:MAG TPA: hypothetical protein VH092_09835 [Urbifossiella sp.]|jgi:hypothetical protein|nr:hypothetical protein [Urbifossiella sp.]
MTCQSVQARILALPDPRRLPDALRAHADGCPDCLGWWKQAARLESLVAALPVPPAPAGKKTAMLEELAAEGLVFPKVTAPPRRGWSVPRPPAKALAGLAAAVLVAVGLWSAVRGGKQPPVVVKAPAPRYPLLEKVVQHDLALAKAKTPGDRLDALAGLAEDLAAEGRGLALVAGADEMREFADWFRTVVADGVVEQAGRVPPHALTPDQRRALFDRLTARLAEAGQAAERAAKDSPPHAQPALRSIADTARDGQTKLRAIAAREGA